MARPPRFDYDGAWHHVFNRGRMHQPVFIGTPDFRLFTALLGDTVERFEIEVHSFALMDNHFHLLMRSVGGQLSNAMQFLLGQFTVVSNLRHCRDGALFKGRFGSKLIETERYLLEVFRYVANNPVKAGLVARPEDYEWSSYRHDVGRQTPPKYLSVDYFGQHFGHRRAMHEFVTAGVGPKRHRLMQLALEESPATYSLHEAMTLADRSAQERICRQIQARVAAAFGVVPAEIMRNTPGKRNDARALAVHLARKSTDLTLAEIARAYGFASRASVSRVLRDFDSRVAADPDLARHLDNLTTVGV